MKKQVEIKQDEKSFERFNDLFRKVISVPKEEINKREQLDKQAKEEKKAHLILKP
jgi:hypothetical protein